MSNPLDWFSKLTGVHAIRSSLPMSQSDDEVTLDIAGYRQTDTFSCGASAGYTIVKTFHPEVDFDDFFTALRPDPERGVSVSMLLRALKKFKVGTSIKDYMSFREIAKAIDSGYPVIVGRLTEHGQDHWSVIYGYGNNPQRVFLVNRSGNPLLPPIMGWTEFQSSFRAVGGPAIKCWGR